MVANKWIVLGAFRCNSDSHPMLVDLCMSLGEGRLAADSDRVVDLNYLSHLAARLLLLM